MGSFSRSYSTRNASSFPLRDCSRSSNSDWLSGLSVIFQLAFRDWTWEPSECLHLIRAHGSIKFYFFLFCCQDMCRVVPSTTRREWLRRSAVDPERDSARSLPNLRLCLDSLS